MHGAGYAGNRARGWRYWWCVGVALLLFPAGAAAQDAQLQGVVKDQSGAVIPGASVSVHSPTTGARRSMTTDAAGRYVFALLGPGDYTVTAELNGFQPV